MSKDNFSVHLHIWPRKVWPQKVRVFCIQISLSGVLWPYLLYPWCGPFVAGPFVSRTAPIEARSFVAGTFRIPHLLKPDLSPFVAGPFDQFLYSCEQRGKISSQESNHFSTRVTGDENVLLHLIRMSNFSVSCCVACVLCNAYRLNIELDLQSLFGLHVLIGWELAIPPSPRIWAHIRGR
jgi:hypothetical protein